MGRGKERASFSRALREVQEGKGRSWTIEGPEGIGKTRLARWTQQSGEKLGFRAFWGYSLKEVNAPFFPFQQIFRSLHKRSPPGGPIVGRWTPALLGGTQRGPSSSARELGEGTEHRRGSRGLYPFVAESPKEQRPAATLFDYLETLEAATSRGPVLLVVDDLQWADPDSIRAFQFLARNIRDLPVALVATLSTDCLRPREERAESPHAEVLDAMEREGTLQRLPLSGLEPEGAMELLRELLGLPLAKGPDGGQLHDLLRRTGGNPFFLQETMRQFARAGYLRRERGHIVLDLPGEGEGSERPLIPETLRRSVTRRLERLGEDEREVLRWAAVVGSEFDLSPLRGVLPRPATFPHDVLDRLERQHHLVKPRSPSGADLWSFAHPLLWEVTLDEIPRAERRDRALRLGDWWAEHRPSEEGTVARLYHEAEVPARGLPWVRRALDSAVAALAQETVERYLRWLEEMLELAEVPADERVQEGLRTVERLERELGPSRPLLRIYQRLLGEHPSDRLRWTVSARMLCMLAAIEPLEAGKRLRKLRAEVKDVHHAPPEVRVAIALASSSLCSATPDLPGMLAGAREALSLLGTSGDAWDRGTALYRGGWALSQLGRRAEADGWLERLRVVVEEGGWPRLRDHCLSLESFMALTRGDLREAQAATERLVALDRSLANHRGLGVQLFNLAHLLSLRGETREGLAAAAEAQRLAERFALPVDAGLARMAQGEVLLRQGRVVKARTCLSEALAVFARTDFQEMEPDCRLFLAETLLLGGDLASAIEECGKVRTGSTVASDIRYRAPLVRAWVHEALGEEKEARRKLLESLREVEGMRNAVGEAQVKTSLGRWEEAHGDPARGRALHAEASALFDTCGILPEGWLRHWPPERVFARSSRAARKLPAPRWGSPLGAEGSEGRRAPLSLSQRIVLHLASQGTLRREDVAPLAFTQEGMALVLHRGQSVFVKSLHRLEATGHVKVEVRYVQGESRQRKVYLLTTKGETLARELWKAGDGT